MKGDWGDVNFQEVGMTISVSAMIGLTRFLYLLRRGRKFVWFDIILEPCLAVIGGMLIWGLATLAGMPGIMVTVLASLGSWGGPKTIHRLELKYLGGRRLDDTVTSPVPLE